MATDIEFSSCSSSLVDSGFESSPPKAPPRRKRSKSTWSLAEKVPEVTRRKSSTLFSEILAPLKNFAPTARDRLKQSFWSLVLIMWLCKRYRVSKILEVYANPSGFVYSQMTIATNRPLYEEEWFHGVLPREEVVRLLRLEGDFLVRETTRNDESQTVLSVCWNGHKHFIVQITAEVCVDTLNRFLCSTNLFLVFLSRFRVITASRARVFQAFKN